METWRYVHFPVKQAWRFADLSGVADDIEAVETLCERFIKESGKKRPDMLLCEALCTAALVKFGRAHGSGAEPEFRRNWLMGYQLVSKPRINSSEICEISGSRTP